MGALYFFAKVIGLESRKLPRSPPSIRTHAHNVHLEFLSDRVLQLILRSCSYVYPPKGRAKRAHWGPLNRETKIELSKTLARNGLF